MPAARTLSDRASTLARVEQALRELPLAEAEIAAVAVRLLDSNLLLRENRPADAGSPFFDFRGKVTAVAERFRDHGLTLPDYLRAAVKQPSLFTQAPATIIANVEGVAEHFAPDGLTLPAYLRGAVKRPSLFTRAPATIQSNVEAVVTHFQEHGLILKDYLRAAVRLPSLFTRAPATIQSNVEAVAEHFRGHGLTLPAYLRAAVKQPPLFALIPPTVIRHVNLLIDMQREGLVTFPGQDDAPAGQPLAPLFAFLLKNPLYLSLADDNYALRVAYARVTGDRPAGTALLTRPRHRIERDLAQALGQPRPGEAAT